MKNIICYKRHLIILCLLIFSCKEKEQYESLSKKTEKREYVLKKQNDSLKKKELTEFSYPASIVLGEDTKYVIAKSGLNYRDKPKGKIAGKFEFGQRLKIIEHTNIYESIKDGNEFIKGEWLGVQIRSRNKLDVKYVFDGFLTGESEFQEINKFSHEDLIGKSFFVYDEKNKVVNDATFTKGPDLRFNETEIIETRVMENHHNIVSSYTYEDGFLIYNKGNYPLKFKYDKLKGLLTEYYTDNTTVKYIDSAIVFQNGSKIKYNYIPESTFLDEYAIDYTNFRKKSISIKDDREMPYAEWIEDGQSLLDSAVGDINNDGKVDGIYFTISDRFNNYEEKSNEFEVTTLILLGTNNKGQFKLYHKSKTIAPGYYEKYGTLYTLKRDQPFWVEKIDKGILNLTVDYEGLEGETLNYYFTFEYKKNKMILKGISKSFTNEEGEFPQKLNLPNFDLTIKEFDIYKFMDIDSSGF